MKNKVLLFLSFFILIARPLYADTLSDLKDRLDNVEQERAWLIKRIQALESSESNAFANRDAPQSSPQTEQIKKYQTTAKITYYWDSREFNTFAILTSTTLPKGFSFWGFTDLHGAQNEIQDSFDQSRFFMEYRLSQKINSDWIGGLKGLGWQAEYNDANGSSNEVVRLGLTYKHSIPSFMDKDGWLQWRAFPYETDGDGQQASIIFYYPFTSRLWVSGFADLNIREGSDEQWVIEPQLNYKLNEKLNFVTEYRYNGFEDASATLKGEGVALGLQYTF